MRWTVAVAVFTGLTCAHPNPSLAFRACTPVSAQPPAGHWPDPNNTGGFGTQKWEFDWQVADDGLEVSSVRYTADLTQPKKMVLRRASLPFLPVHYPDTPPSCGGQPHGYNDKLGSFDLDTANPFCCFHVPTTVCNLPDRPQACNPASGTVNPATCPAGSISCDGVCVGTQIDSSVPLEDGMGEVVSGSSSADVVLSATFKLGGYQFVQRWRFRDDGSILPSLRAGGVHTCQWHNHQIYWRFNFELVDGGTGQAESVQQCDAGGCPDMGSLGWSASLGCKCGTRPSGATWWRVGDSGVAGRAVIVQTGTTEGAASTFCENTTTECSSGCFNSRDFCALATAEPTETFVSDNCNDHLDDQISQPACATMASGGDTTFWYFAHLAHHDPCTFLPMCDPELGVVSFGPTIRLVGTW